MVVAVALWSLELNPGEAVSVVPPSDLRITNVALADELADERGRTSVKLTYRAPKDGEEDEDVSHDEEEEEEDAEPVTTVLCSLTPGKIEQSTVDLILEQEQEVLLEVVGKNTVFLTGNYIDQIPHNPYDDSEDDFDSEDEEAYRLEDVSSDVEIDADELDEDDDSHRFEEVADEPAQAQKPESKKRARESDATENDDSKLSKTAQKKLNKKLKAEGGKAVPAGDEAEKPKDKKKEQPKKEEKSKEAEKVKTLDGGLKIQDHKVGTGPAAKSGNLVRVRYVGKLPNGKIFDSNTKGDPFKFKLGKGEVIKGWDAGIAGMQVGGERLLTIPPTLAYGKRAQGGIPANSTLIFEVKLLGIN
ncbi:hypothetical protein PHLGIDRAFT_24709 [Phlebiopsis gigantea 11061_1 CR5-6]|uniref:FK506-binding protein n=1 Tax=Phlebiopsis gigantea (strain 11061_1 CR5-6) TaxID=745531 RepID=A0A0C3PJ65_PHLG1|nr:hypothetical protein PHLGIDRAFT_24709 [Phlebiopsis gigantea 11061_1 CR5-6]